MNLKRLLENLSAAMAAQLATLAIGLVGGFLVPRVLGVSAYGYWQLFILYATYTGFFHLGLNDGVYLTNIGMTLEEIDKSDTISQYGIGLGFQVVFASLLAAAALATQLGHERAFILCMTAIYMLVCNSIDFFGYVFQAGNRTKLYSHAIVIAQFMYLALILVLLGFGVRDFKFYIACYVIARVCALSFLLYRARDILRATMLPLRRAASLAAKSIAVGSKLMIANVAAMLVIDVVRLVIDARWDIAVFGEVSFALALAIMLLSFVSQVGMVLSPALRHSQDDYIIRFYSRAKNLLDVVLPSVYLAYFPIRLLIALWLPRYTGSLPWLAVLLPMCVFSARMTIMSATYYRVLRKESDMLKVSVLGLTVSGLGAVVGGYVYHSLGVVVGAAVAAVALCSLVSELQLTRYLQAERSSMVLGEALVAAVFVACTLNLSTESALLATGIAYGVYLLLYRQAAYDLIGQARRLNPARDQ